VEGQVVKGGNIGCVATKNAGGRGGVRGLKPRRGLGGNHKAIQSFFRASGGGIGELHNSGVWGGRQPAATTQISKSV